MKYLYVTTTLIAFIISTLVAVLIGANYSWPAGIAIATLLFFVIELLVLFTAGTDSQKVEEKWGEFAESHSGVSWNLPRMYHYRKGDIAADIDSKEFLRGKGFRILGIVDDIYYKVEPPIDWVIDSIGPQCLVVYDADGRSTHIMCHTPIGTSYISGYTHAYIEYGNDDE